MPAQSPLPESAVGNKTKPDRASFPKEDHGLSYLHGYMLLSLVNVEYHKHSELWKMERRVLFILWVILREVN